MRHILLVWWFTYTLTNAAGQIIDTRTSEPYRERETCEAVRAALSTALLLPGLSYVINPCQTLDRSPR